MAFEPKHRNLRGVRSPMITAAVIRSEYRDGFAPAVKNDPRSSKELARIAGVTARQIDNIRQDLSGTSVPVFFALARKIPEIRATALRWLEAERDLDPSAERLHLELQSAVSNYLRREQERLQEAAG